jgi:2-oxoisovalerate dehydrogenase E1 component
MALRAAAIAPPAAAAVAGTSPDWRRVASLLQASRALDDIEETQLVPQRKVLYQFSAR